MNQRLLSFVSILALLTSLFGPVPVSAQAGTLSVTLDADSPAGDRPVSTNAPLIKFTLRATGADVAVALFRMKISAAGLNADKLYFFVEETNALIGSAEGTATDLVFNGLLVRKDDPTTVVLKADVRGPNSNLISATVTETVTATGVTVQGVPLSGHALRFTDGSTTVGGEEETVSDVTPEPEPVVEGEPDAVETGDGESSVIAPGDEAGADAESDAVIARELELFEQEDVELVERTKGRILLQVEEHGEAWYVEPDREEKYYMRDGNAAYAALRRFGLGITNADLEKIPVGIEDRFEELDTDADGLSDKLEEALGSSPTNPDSDADGFADGAEVASDFSPTGPDAIRTDALLRERLAGKILLQVESRGEAWYINPADHRRYYMTDGSAAYQIMRFLSLGITNTDLRRIPVGE